MSIFPVVIDSLPSNLDPYFRQLPPVNYSSFVRNKEIEKSFPSIRVDGKQFSRRSTTLFQVLCVCEYWENLHSATDKLDKRWSTGMQKAKVITSNNVDQYSLKMLLLLS
jgi:hypothetical protein